MSGKSALRQKGNWSQGRGPRAVLLPFQDRRSGRKKVFYRNSMLVTREITYSEVEAGKARDKQSIKLPALFGCSVASSAYDLSLLFAGNLESADFHKKMNLFRMDDASRVTLFPKFSRGIIISVPSSAALEALRLGLSHETLGNDSRRILCVNSGPARPSTAGIANCCGRSLTVATANHSRSSTVSNVFPTTHQASDPRFCNFPACKVRRLHFIFVNDPTL